MSLVIAIVVLAAGWWLIKTMGRAKPADFRQWKSKAIGAAILLVAALAALRGNIELGVPLLALGLGILGKDSILPQFLKLRGGGTNNQSRNQPPPRSGGRMSAKEALNVLGLAEGASAEQIREAHKRLLKSFHPDKGGTNYIAAKINEAKDVLLG